MELTGLEGLSQIDGAVEIYINFNLPTCSALELVSHFEDQGWDGDVCVYSNDEDECQDDMSGC